MIEFWQSVPWTVDYTQDLRDRQQEIDQLWDEKEHHRLTEVPEDSSHGKGHSSCVAESVSNEYLRWESVVFQ